MRLLLVLIFLVIAGCDRRKNVCPIDGQPPQWSGRRKGQLDRGEKLLLIDVREESEYAKDHLPGAIHLGKGVIERDIEEHVPDLTTPMVLYCGGGYRSALTADNLQKMGYTNVLSMDGGARGWREKGLPMSKD